jgi:hypothetical protein
MHDGPKSMIGIQITVLLDPDLLLRSGFLKELVNSQSIRAKSAGSENPDFTAMDALLYECNLKTASF